MPELHGVSGIGNQILATFASTHELHRAPREDAPALLRPLLEQLLTHFGRIEQTDIRLRLAADEMPEAEFVQMEEELLSAARGAVATAEVAVEFAKSIGMEKSSYAAVETRAYQMRLAFDWTHADYVASPAFNQLLDETIEEHNAGKTVEGGFGK